MRLDRGPFPFVHTIGVLAAEHGRDVRISVRMAGHGADVVVKRQYAEVSVSLALLAQPAAEQEFAAAHEIAHVVLRHMFWRRVAPAVAWAVTVIGLVFSGLWLTAQLGAVPPGPVVRLMTGGLGLLVAGIGAWAVLAGRTRRSERDADRLANVWGYTLVGSKNARTRGENRVTLSRLYRPFRMHPPPNHRDASHPEKPADEEQVSWPT